MFAPRPRLLSGAAPAPFRMLLPALLWLLALLPAHVTHGAEIAKEHQIKAAFLYNFTKFIDWPEQCLGAPADALVIGVLEDPAFADELERVVHDRKVNGHPIQVVRLKGADRPARLHALFVPTGEEKRCAREFGELHARGVLTVGESDAFETAGGIIAFRPAGDLVRFAINVAAAETAGLRVSSHLLKLAIIVHPGGEKAP